MLTVVDVEELVSRHGIPQHKAQVLLEERDVVTSSLFRFTVEELKRVSRYVHEKVTALSFRAGRLVMGQRKDDVVRNTARLLIELHGLRNHVPEALETQKYSFSWPVPPTVDLSLLNSKKLRQTRGPFADVLGVLGQGCFLGSPEICFKFKIDPSLASRLYRFESRASWLTVSDIRSRIVLETGLSS